MKIARMENLNDMRGCDVAHVVDFNIDVNVSILKVVRNICRNSNHRQFLISSTFIPRENISFILNDLGVGVLHLHSNTDAMSDSISSGEFKGKIIQTIHHTDESTMGANADVIACIHKPAMDINEKFGNAIIINNTVEVGHGVPTNGFESFMTMSRVSRYYIYPDMITDYDRLGVPFNLYGHLISPSNPYPKGGFTDKLLEASSGTAVSMKPWCSNIESTMAKNSVYVFDQPETFPHRCYGLSIMEACGFGMSIIALERSQDHQTYIVDGYNGFIAKNHDEVLSLCRRVASDNALYKEITQNAQAHKHTLKNTMPKKYDDLYKLLLADLKSDPHLF